LAYSTIELDIQNQDHRAALIRMWSENLPHRDGIGQVVGARLRWLYDDNPDGPPRTLLALHGEQKEIVGCGSTLRRRMWAFGRMVETGMPCDFAVVKKHRIGGAAIGIQRALTEGSRAAGQTFLCGSPNRKSLPITKRIGYQVIGDAHAWVKPLRSAYKLGEYVKSPLLARLAGPVLDVALRTMDRVRVPPRRKTWGGEILERADARFDGLWERARERYTLIGEKTAGFLNWRYGGFTTQRYRIFALTAQEGGRVAGFVVYAVVNDKVFVADLFAEDLEGALDQLLMGFARVVRREGHVSIFLNYVGSAAFGERLKRLGYFRTADLKRSLVVFFEKGTPSELASELLKRENWLMFDGDMDI
jgi:hypothetical protein